MIKTWATGHAYRVLASVLAVTILAGGVGYAVVQQSDAPAERAAGSRTRQASSAAVPLRSGQQVQEPGSAAENKMDAQPAPFTINCPQAKSVPVQNGDSFDCKVTAEPGFGQPITLACVNAPRGLDCLVSPRTVTPSGGSAEFKVGLSNNSVRPGKHDFLIVGTAGSLSSRFTFPFQLKAPSDPGAAPARVDASCESLPGGQITRGETASVACSLTASPAFQGTVKLSCIAPGYLNCRVGPESATPTSSAPAKVTVTLTASDTSDLGQTEFTLSGISPDSFNTNHLPRSTVVVRVVAPPGPPPASDVIADYTFTCADAAVAADSSTQFPCVGASHSYTGPVNLKVTADGSGGPVVTVVSQIAMRPGLPHMVVTSVDATNTTPGSYSYTATAWHDAAVAGRNYKFTVVVSAPASDR